MKWCGLYSLRKPSTMSLDQSVSRNRDSTSSPIVSVQQVLLALATVSNGGGGVSLARRLSNKGDCCGSCSCPVFPSFVLRQWVDRDDKGPSGKLFALFEDSTEN